MTRHQPSSALPRDTPPAVVGAAGVPPHLTAYPPAGWPTAPCCGHSAGETHPPRCNFSCVCWLAPFSAPYSALPRMKWPGPPPQNSGGASLVVFAARPRPASQPASQPAGRRAGGGLLDMDTWKPARASVWLRAEPAQQGAGASRQPCTRALLAFHRDTSFPGPFSPVPFAVAARPKKKECCCAAMPGYNSSPRFVLFALPCVASTLPLCRPVLVPPGAATHYDRWPGQPPFPYQYGLPTALLSRCVGACRMLSQVT